MLPRQFLEEVKFNNDVFYNDQDAQILNEIEASMEQMELEGVPSKMAPYFIKLYTQCLSICIAQFLDPDNNTANWEKKYNRKLLTMRLKVEALESDENV